jgi:uncharacterized phage-like protein YoqJ
VRNQTCCFSGHRTIPEWTRDSLSTKLNIELRKLILSGYRYFGAGGALGFDTMAAQAVLRFRREFPQIKLILVLPCKDQALRWPEASKAEYENIKRQANKVVYMAESYTPECMFQRNRHLVDQSSTCLCYLTRKSGGTAYTVDYACYRNLQVINLASD